MKFNKKNILLILLFIFTFCFNMTFTYADCVYNFSDKKSKKGTLTIYQHKVSNDVSDVEVKFNGDGNHLCDALCEKSSREVFVVEDSKLYCPRTAYYCYVDGKNMIQPSPDKCKKPEYAATIYLSDNDGTSQAYVPIIDSKTGAIQVCSKGGAAKAEQLDIKLKDYEKKSAEYLKNPPSESSKITEITNEISDIKSYESYCDQGAFKSKNFSARLQTLNAQLTTTAGAMYKNGTLNDSDYSKIISGISKAFSVGQISLPTSDTQYTCEGLLDKDLQLVINYVLTIIQIGAPILLIILVTIDFASVVISQDKDATKKATSKAIKRGIAAIVIFFVPLIVKLILGWAGITDTCGF